MCVSGTRVFVLEETSHLAAALKLHFSRDVRRLLLVNTESGALLFDERRTRRERKERESFILLSSIARIKSILVREKSASFSSHRFSGKSIERIESHREE